MRLVFLLGALLCGGQLAGVQLGLARAQAPGEKPAAQPDASDGVAKGLFQAGAAAFEAGQFEEALQHFQEAYARSPRPKLLFNIGQAADRLRKDDVALDAFQRYLAEVPDAEGREQIEARVRVLEQLVAERKAQEEAAAAASQATTSEAEEPATVAPEDPASDSAEPQSFPWAPVAVLGAGVVAIAVGGAFGMIAKGEEDDYAKLEIGDPADAREARSLLDDAEGHATLSNILIGAGAALTAVSAVWLVLVVTDDGTESEPTAKAEQEPSVALAPRVGPGAFGLVLSARYGGGP